MGFLIIKTTFANKVEAEKIAKILVENNMAACVQLSDVESYYKWEGKIENSKECKVEIKALSDNYKKIEELIIKNHSYKVPEIVAVEIKKESKGYLNWMEGLE